MKLRNVILTSLFILFLIGPICLWGVQSFTALPGWLTAKNSTYLSGGIDKADIKKSFSINGFATEQLQNSLEINVGNNIPMKATALLTNASIQRSAIKASNCLFQFDVFPTFFGSETIYDEPHNSLVAFPATDTYYMTRSKQVADGIANLAKRLPEKNFYLVMSDITDTTKANPAIPLISKKAYTTKEFVDVMKNAMKGLKNVHVISVTYNSLDDYYKNYYTTDHHWNGFGTIETYKALTSVADLRKEFGQYNEVISFGDFVTNGSYAREGLMLLNESVLEPKFDLSGLSIDTKNAPPIMEKDSVNKLKKKGLKAAYSFYPQWYGTAEQTSKTPITNEKNADGKNAVVIMDSYADSLHWLLAQNYRYLQCFKDIRHGSSGKESLSDRINESNADDIYFIGSALAYTRIPSNFPNYFN